MPRAELSIHGLNRWIVKCLEMSRKRGVQTVRNAPSVGNLRNLSKACLNRLICVKI